MPSGIDVNVELDRYGASVLDALTEEVRGSLAQAIGVQIYNRWQYYASRLDRPLSATYQQAIQAVRLDGTTAVVVLAGKEANAIENGRPGGDMRTWLLGPNVPVVPRGLGLKGKQQSMRTGGYYRAIPFRHGSPTSRGSAGTPMGKAYADTLGLKHAEDLGRAIYAAAKKLRGSTTEPFRVDAQRMRGVRPRKQNTSWGQKLKPGIGRAPLLRPHHSVDIYAGMVKMRKTYSRATQSTYMTFRTISTSNTNGWYARPTEGAKLMDKVRDDIPAMGKRLLQSFARAISSRSKEEGEST